MAPKYPTTKPKQDMPPQGGYPKVRINRIDNPRGIPGIAMFIGLAVATTYGLYQVIRTGGEVAAIRREQRESRLALQPYFIAENDVGYMRFYNYHVAKEAEAIGNNNDVHKPGQSAYSSRWSPPVYGRK